MQTEGCSNSNPPTLPPLYFSDKDEESSTQNFIIEPLPSEILSSITGFLDWGDLGRLSATNTRFKSIVDDAATLSNQKWDLALALLKGTNGFESNPSRAMKYLHEIAGTSVSTHEFNPNYEKSHLDSTEIDEERKIANTAMKKLAMCLLEGNGVDKDLQSGLAWLKAATLNGDIEAAYETALIYEYSRHGVEVDIILAAQWFLGASSAGHVESMAEYAMCLELGCGVEQSDDEALDWYTKAAQSGHSSSNYSVGEMFEEARGGLPQSDSEACLWYYKAALMGEDDAKNALKRLNDIARIVVPGWAKTLNV